MDDDGNTTVGPDDRSWHFPDLSRAKDGPWPTEHKRGDRVGVNVAQGQNHQVD